MVDARPRNVERGEKLEGMKQLETEVAELAQLRQLEIEQPRVTLDENRDAVVVETCEKERETRSTRDESAGGRTKRTSRLTDPEAFELVLFIEGLKIGLPLLCRYEKWSCQRRNTGIRMRARRDATEPATTNQRATST